MPIDELTGGVVAGIARLLGRLFSEVLLEILVRGLGYLVCRIFTRRVDPDGLVVLVVGLSVWILVGGVAYAIWADGISPDSYHNQQTLAG